MSRTCPACLGGVLSGVAGWQLPQDGKANCKNTSSLLFPSRHSPRGSASCDMPNLTLSLRLRTPRPQEQDSPSLDRFDSETYSLALDLRAGTPGPHDEELEHRAIFCLLCIHTYRITSRLRIVAWVAFCADTKSTRLASRGVGVPPGLPARQPRLHLTISATPYVSCRGAAASLLTPFIQPGWKTDRTTILGNSNSQHLAERGGVDRPNWPRGKMNIHQENRATCRSTMRTKNPVIKINEQHAITKQPAPQWEAANSYWIADNRPYPMLALLSRRTTKGESDSSIWAKRSPSSVVPLAMYVISG